MGHVLLGTTLRCDLRFPTRPTATMSPAAATVKAVAICACQAVNCPSRSGTPISCPAGSQSSLSGQANVTQTSPTVLAMLLLKAMCDLLGTAQDMHRIADTLCPSGTFSNVSGVLNVLSFPGICACGYSYCPVSSGIPTPCPPGTFNTITGARNPSTCRTDCHARHRTTFIRTVYLACVPPVHTVLRPQVWVLL